MVIPAALLRRFYLDRSLQNAKNGFEFKLKNLVAPATVISLGPVEVNGIPYAANQVTLTGSKPRRASSISSNAPFHLKMGKEVNVHVQAPPLSEGEHELSVHVVTKEVGAVVIGVNERI